MIEQPIEKLALTVKEAARVLGISKNGAYVLIAQGKIPVVRFGRKILVSRVGLERMFEIESSAEEKKP